MKKSDIPDGIYISKFTNGFNLFVVLVNGEFFHSKLDRFESINSILFLKSFVLTSNDGDFITLPEDIYEFIKQYFILAPYDWDGSKNLVEFSVDVEFGYTVNIKISYDIN